jgi:hypothetical protein
VADLSILRIIKHVKIINKIYNKDNKICKHKDNKVNIFITQTKIKNNNLTYLMNIDISVYGLISKKDGKYISNICTIH